MLRALNFGLQTLVASWLGLSVFFTFAVGTAFFSEPVYAIFQEAGASDPKYFSGILAMVMLQKYFIWHHVCGCLALALLLGERFMIGRFRDRLALALTGLLLVLGALGGWGFQPKLHALHRLKYDVQASAGEREAAGKQFGALHGVSQLVNLGMLAGLLGLCWRCRSPAGQGN